MLIPANASATALLVTGCILPSCILSTTEACILSTTEGRLSILLFNASEIPLPYWYTAPHVGRLASDASAWIVVCISLKLPSGFVRLSLPLFPCKTDVLLLYISSLDK